MPIDMRHSSQSSLGKAKRIKLAPQFTEQTAVFNGLVQHIPFFITGEGGLRHVRAADDDRAGFALIKNVSLGMQITLEYANFHVVVFQELAKGIG